MSGVSAAQMLNVSLHDPLSPFTITQNHTFVVNATVSCLNGDCGTVTGTARYNQSSTPDTAIPQGTGEPFHVLDQNPLTCSTDLVQDASCNVTWTVNATGTIGTKWLVDVRFTSDVGGVTANDTDDANIEIFGDIISIRLGWTDIDFGSLFVGTTDNPAENNTGRVYNVTVLPETTTNVDLWMNGSDLQQEDGSDVIGVSNLSFNASENDPSFTTRLATFFTRIARGVAPGINTTTYYWFDVPLGIYADNYTGGLEVMANKTQ